MISNCAFTEVYDKQVVPVIDNQIYRRSENVTGIKFELTDVICKI